MPKVAPTMYVYNHFQKAILNRQPFSLIRFGDGGLKFIQSVVNNDKEQLDVICKKEGIISSRVVEVLESWGWAARGADYVDCPEVYFTGRFWKRFKKFKNISQETLLLLKNWKEFYSRAEIDNVVFCNPEINFLMSLYLQGRPNILDLMRDRKVCCITSNPDLKLRLREYGYDIDVLKIVGQYEEHQMVSYPEVVSFININANAYDFWLIAAGEVGRVYPALIKKLGGRAFDIGSLVDYWVKPIVPQRLVKFMKVYEPHKLLLELTEEGKKYEEAV